MKPALVPRLAPGTTALLISVPHAGETVPKAIAGRLTPPARALPDTDWHVDRLYEWATAAGAGMLVASASRYVVDLNRPPDDAPLYDIATTRLKTGVVPLQSFDGRRLYRSGEEPGGEEIAARIRDHWQPYHAILAAELERIRARHGHAVLLDAHSIRHALPLLFEGALPDLNLGSNGGTSTAPSLLARAREALAHEAYTLAVDGRFKGGYITRHYGKPATGVHALQLELAQRTYLREDTARWIERRAAALRPVLRRLVEALIEWTPDGG